MSVFHQLGGQPGVISTDAHDSSHLYRAEVSVVHQLGGQPGVISTDAHDSSPTREKPDDQNISDLEHLTIRVCRYSKIK